MLTVSAAEWPAGSQQWLPRHWPCTHLVPDCHVIRCGHGRNGRSLWPATSRVVLSGYWCLGLGALGIWSFLLLIQRHISITFPACMAFSQTRSRISLGFSFTNHCISSWNYFSTERKKTAETHNIEKERAASSRGGTEAEAETASNCEGLQRSEKRAKEKPH